MPYLGVKPADEFTSKDLNGEQLILDADADTTITADTDDQIDIRIAGADDFQFTANTFTAQSGSTIAAQALTATTIGSSAGVTITGTTPTLTIGDAGAEDAKIVFDGNAQDFHIGLDDTADDLVIGLGSALGTTTHMAFTEAGEIIKPLQPAFLVQPTSKQTNIAVGGYVNIVFGTERFDVGSNFASNTFTAPVTGKYQLNLHVRLDTLDTDVSSMYYQIYIWTSNNQFASTTASNSDSFNDDIGFWPFAFGVLADMDASDTAYCRVYQSDGAVQTDIDQATWFSGYLAT